VVRSYFAIVPPGRRAIILLDEWTGWGGGGWYLTTIEGTIMRRIIFAALAFLFVTGTAFAESLFFLSSEKVELLKLLPPPPDPKSEAQRRDMAAVLEMQRIRTPEMIKRAEADNVLSIFRYDDVLGPDFRPDKLPVSVEFFKRTNGDARVILNATKEAWNRPRPFNVSADIQPLGQKPRTNFAYPSGTTIFGSLTAILLANMIPEKRVEIFTRSAEFSANRIVLGVHYPSDIEAGRIAATVMAAALFQNPVFMTELANARAELRTVLGYDRDPLVAQQRREDDDIATGSVPPGSGAR
jgi:acid phosphatase (class A)